jgi:hypothetical protein
MYVTQECFKRVNWCRSNADRLLYGSKARQDRKQTRKGRRHKGGGALDPGPLLSDEGMQLQAGRASQPGRLASPRPWAITLARIIG